MKLTSKPFPIVPGRRICAWCEKDMGPAPTEFDTHGICPECYAREMAKIEGKKGGPT